MPKTMYHDILVDIVEQLIGPDILLYSAAYIVKEAHSESHVSWHQDLTYWGLDSNAPSKCMAGAI